MITPETIAHARVHLAHDVAVRAGEYVLYWLRAYRRAEDNLALDHAIVRANSLGIPLLVVESLDVRYPYASDRMHAFVLESAVDRAAVLALRGAQYCFYLPRTREEITRDRPLDLLAQRAALVVSDWYPACGPMAKFWDETPRALGQRAGVRVELIDDAVVVPMALLCEKHEHAARTIRPKVQRRLEVSLTESQSPTVTQRGVIAHEVPHTAVTREGIDALIAACAIDHTVPRVRATEGSREQARARLQRLLTQRLGHYSARRNDMGVEGSSALSAHLHFGVLSVREVARAVRGAEGVTREERDAFVEELVVRRSLAFNHVMTEPRHTEYDGGVPAWARETLATASKDSRTAHTFAQWEQSLTSSPLWNCAQRELVRDGVIQPYARMLWGKLAIAMAESPAQAFAWLIALNDKWALDGRDPNTYTNIAWCFGLHDHPYPTQKVFGSLRSMTAAAAARKWDVQAYAARLGMSLPRKL